MNESLELLVDGVDFGEGPRWHDGELWYSDFYQAAIYRVSSDGTRTAVHSGLSDRPSGLGWLPDGSLVVVSMVDRKLLREVGGELVEYADLSALTSEMCNDMVVNADGNAYVGNFGFDLDAGADVAATKLVLVRPGGKAELVGNGLLFPNGSVITPDGSTLIVAETFGASFTAFTINDDATLGDQRKWAEIEGAFPDGCCLDAAGGIWFCDAFGARVMRVLEGGEVTHEIPTPMNTFACMLGGDDGKTLHILCSPSGNPDEVAGQANGAIYTVRVDVAGAGLP